MSTNGIVLLNLDNLNANDLSSYSVPGSYDKALGAATAGTYVTVYKWLYNGFMMGASVCTAEQKTGYVSLVDKTNGGELRVYSDNKITLVGGEAPVDPYSGKAIRVQSYDESDVFAGITIQSGTVDDVANFTPDNTSPITLSKSRLKSIINGIPYIVEGFIAVVMNTYDVLCIQAINDSIRSPFFTEEHEFDGWGLVPVNWNGLMISTSEDFEFDKIFKHI